MTLFLDNVPKHVEQMIKTFWFRPHYKNKAVVMYKLREFPESRNSCDIC